MNHPGYPDLLHSALTLNGDYELIGAPDTMFISEKVRVFVRKKYLMRQLTREEQDTGMSTTARCHG